MEKRKEIRVVDPPKEIWDAITKLAKKEKRSIGKQAEYILELYFQSQKIK